jgi:hypothetical protein
VGVGKAELAPGVRTDVGRLSMAAFVGVGRAELVPGVRTDVGRLSIAASVEGTEGQAGAQRSDRRRAVAVLVAMDLRNPALLLLS